MVVQQPCTFIEFSPRSNVFFCRTLHRSAQGMYDRLKLFKKALTFPIFINFENPLIQAEKSAKFVSLKLEKNGRI